MKIRSTVPDSGPGQEIGTSKTSRRGRYGIGVSDGAIGKVLSLGQEKLALQGGEVALFPDESQGSTDSESEIRVRKNVPGFGLAHSKLSRI